MTPSRSIHRRGTPPARQLSELSQLLRQAIVGATFTADDAVPPLRVPRAAVPTAPARLAEAADPAHRAALTATYERYLQGYRSAAPCTEPGEELDDAGQAVACFVAINMQVLHGTAPNDTVLQALERQLRPSVLRSTEWAGGTLEQRQMFVEQTIVIGMIVAAAHARADGDAAARVQVRQAAHRYLQRLLGLDADLLALSPTGLVARAPKAAGAAALAVQPA